MKGWKEKRLLTFPVNGERRSLGWSKVLYREWFRYAQLSPQPIPIEFGDLSLYGKDREYSHANIHERSYRKNRKGDYTSGRFNKVADIEFEKWWKDHRELFLEPSPDPAVEVLTKGRIKADDDHLILRFDLRDYERAKFEFENLIAKHKRDYVFESKARFKPSIEQRSIQLSKLLTYRIAWELCEIDGLSRKMTVIHLMDIGLMAKCESFDSDSLKQRLEAGTLLRGELDPESKRVSFFLGRARSIFQSIEQGTFP